MSSPQRRSHRRTRARITAFSPGQSPPLVRTPTVAMRPFWIGRAGSPAPRRQPARTGHASRCRPEGRVRARSAGVAAGWCQGCAIGRGEAGVVVEPRAHLPASDDEVVIWSSTSGCGCSLGVCHHPPRGRDDPRGSLDHDGAAQTTVSHHVTHRPRPRRGWRVIANVLVRGLAPTPGWNAFWRFLERFFERAAS